MVSVSLGLLPVCGFLLALCCRLLPFPYMDEEFHVRQASTYCEGRFFEWDPKLTTPPGLYLLSLPFLRVAGCSLVAMRAFNALLVGSATLLVLHRLRSTLRGRWEEVNEGHTLDLEVANLFLYPVSFYFHFLYYTDSLSTLSILLMYLLHLKRAFSLAGAVGLFSIAVRQSNVVWVFGLALLRILESMEEQPRKEAGEEGLLGWLWRFVRCAVAESVSRLKVHLLCGLSFVAFLFWNQGQVVLGHQEHHVAGLHSAQLNYMLLFIALGEGPPFLWALLKSEMKIERGGRNHCFVGSSRAESYSNSRFWFFFALFSLFAYFGTIAHPFILSDHRHVTFYLWRYLLRWPAVRLLAVPLLSAQLFLSLDASTLRWREKMVWGLVSVLVLVPSPLLEPRYFTPSVLMYLLHVRRGRDLEYSRLLWNCVINGLALYVLLFCPFYSSQSGEMERFMW